MSAVAVIFSLALAVRVLLGAHILNKFYAYTYQSGGIVLLKVHPGTYLIYALLLYLLLAGPRRPNAIKGATGALGISVFFATAMVVTALSAGRNVGLGFLFDSVLVAPAALVILGTLSPQDRQRIFLTMLGILLVNGLFVGAEAVLGRNIFPYPEMGGTFRPGGLVGHPLLTGVMTVPAIPLIAGMRWGPTSKVLAIGACVGICILSGARAASVAAILAALLSLSVMFWTNMTARGNPLVGGFYLYALLFAVAFGAIFVPQTIFGERIMISLAQDESFMARLEIYQAFSYLQPRELLIGTTQANAERIVERLALDFVESPIVFGVFLFGAIGSVMLFSLYLTVTGVVFRESKAIGRVALFFFLLVALTNNTLTTKVSAYLFATILVASYAFQSTGGGRRDAASVDTWRSRAALYKRG